MGNFLCSLINQPETLILQTGKLRGKNIHNGLNSLDIKNSSVLHRWLPSDFESKYESLDFVTKFNLNMCQFINIQDDYRVDAEFTNGNF